MDFAELERIGVAPTPEGELRSAYAWTIFMAFAALCFGGVAVGLVIAWLAGWVDFGKIGALSGNLLLVFGLSAWLGSYLLLRLAKQSARFFGDPDFVAQRLAMSAAAWTWRGILLVALAAFACCASMVNDLGLVDRWLA